MFKLFGAYVQKFENLRITRKLSLLLGVVLGSFALIGALYLVFVATVARDRAQLDRVTQFSAAATDVEMAGLEARRHEKDFLLRRDTSYVQQHDTAMARVYTQLDKLPGLNIADSEQQAEIASVRQSMQTYDASFKTVVEKAVQLGLDENTGIQGAFRDQVHAVEAEVTSVNNPNLMVSMLMMRRHEKDFLLRKKDDYVNQMGDEYTHWQKLIQTARMPAAVRASIDSHMDTYQKGFATLVAGVKAQDAAVETMRTAFHDAQPKIDALAKLRETLTEQITSAANYRMFVFTLLLGTVLVLIAALLFMAIRLLSSGIARSLHRLLDTIGKLARGDSAARVHLETQDELGELGNAFDSMMDERVALQRKIEKENEQLNNSVLSLLQAVAQLSRRDLTVKVPVSDDVTGAVADALNLMTTETAKVLREVSDISGEVTSASLKVKQQSDTAVAVAETGRQQVDQTALELASAARAMNDIAALAQSCSVSADNAIRTAQSAVVAVNATVGGINNTRDTIRETEKRIKRLGERSQEISGAVNLINTIAERTHILALNASMHAASAGEAGRGFAVVAEEVQRLAESARQATAQISTLVNNIQVETSDTVNTMNDAISQVVQGSKLAEQAGEQMKLTQETTAELVKSVQTIASSSQVQAKVSNELMARAGEIRKSAQHTDEQLRAQTEQSSNLVEYARNLLGAVRVFKLTA
ncbi:MAG TPA: methyl-accepting chemotaxis protein [Gammaproteobacteria bacterium]|nr:methyl-accepting chemotaxis protein [Gammaproteobacteria bacterium]